MTASVGDSRRPDRRTRHGHPATPDAPGDGDPDRYAQLLRVAVDEFATHGYRATSMRMIADAMGLSKPALYHYVRTKEELLVAVFDEVLDQNRRRHRSVTERRLAPEAALREMLVGMIEYNCTNRRALRVFYEEEREIPLGLTQLVQGRRRAQEDTMLAIVRAGVADGTFREDLAKRSALRTIIGAVISVYKWYRPEGHETPATLATQMAEFLIGGLRRTPAPVAS